MGIVERWGEIWGRLEATEAQLPSRVQIPRPHVSGNQVIANGDRAFESGQQYFQVTANQMFLKNGREWLSRYDPMAFVVSEFAYDKERQGVPFVIGPALVNKHKLPVPEGTLFTGTTVAGLHPYAGGSVVLTVFLYRIERKNYLKDLLKLVESAAGALSFATAFVPYTRIAAVVLDGFDVLLDREETEPVLGSRDELGGSGKSFEPACYALVDAPEVDPDELWVKDGQLHRGSTLADAKPYRANDFVLYSVEQSVERNDEQLLPFWPQWERVVGDATTPTEAHWESAKANMVALQRSIELSPDLTEAQKESLADDLIAKMVKAHKRAVKTSSLSDQERTGAPQEKALDILRL